MVRTCDNNAKERMSLRIFDDKRYGVRKQERLKIWMQNNEEVLKKMSVTKCWEKVLIQTNGGEL